MMKKEQDCDKLEEVVTLRVKVFKLKRNFKRDKYPHHH
jgi:hypothetical protein